MWNERRGPPFHHSIPFSWIRTHFNFSAASLINIFSLNIGPQEGNTESERKRRRRERIFCWSREKKLLRNKKRRKSSQDKEKEREGRKRGGNEDFHSFTHPSLLPLNHLSVPFRRPNIPTFVEQVVGRVKKSGLGGSI